MDIYLAVVAQGILHGIHFPVVLRLVIHKILVQPNLHLAPHSGVSRNLDRRGRSHEFVGESAPKWRFLTSWHLRDSLGRSGDLLAHMDRATHILSRNGRHGAIHNELVEGLLAANSADVGDGDAHKL